MDTQKGEVIWCEPLCEDLLLDIFSRLSVTDLIKCKCVTKQWHHIISYICIPRLSDNAPVSGVYYRVARLPREVRYVSTNSPPERKDKVRRQLACCESTHYIDSAPLPEHETGLELPCKTISADGLARMSYASTLPFDHRGPDFLDCCNGLLLFVRRPYPQFYVCNPTIKQCVPIPIPIPPLFVHFSSLYASLAFDPSESIHYRVVVLSIATQPQRLHIFYSQSGKWMTHEVQIELPSSGTCCFQLVRHSVYLKGMLYRLSLLNNVLCFDLNRLKTRLISCPSQAVSPPPGCLGVLNGLISFVNRKEEELCVWLLDNPNESNEWSLKYIIHFPDLVASVRQRSPYVAMVWLYPCAFHPTKDILFLATVSSIVMFHLGSGRTQLVRIFLLRGEFLGGQFFPLFLYRNSFVTLKDWCRGTTTKIDDYKEVHENWCYFEQCNDCSVPEFISNLRLS